MQRAPENVSSTLRNILTGKPIEIDYINGYIVSQGDRLGIPCPNNSIVVDLVKNGSMISNEELPSYFDGYPRT